MGDRGGGALVNVSDVMTRDVVTVSPETPLKDVARLLVERHISGVPVADPTGRLLGVVSEGDFISKEVAAASGLTTPRHHFLRGDDKNEAALIARGNALTAGEAMSSPAITIAPDSSLAQAAQVMGRNGIKRLPVVEDERVVGILSRADVVRSFTRDDAQIGQDVHAALRAVDSIEISVCDGVVTLAGSVSHESIVQTIRTLTASIPGVAAVDATGITWPEPLF
jgi:CBS domain-containing protein